MKAANTELRSLENALRVLDAVAESPREVGVTELSSRTGLSKTGVFRILATLDRAGYVRQNAATKRYRLGLRAWELGCAAIRDVQLSEVARPILERLVAGVQETAVVGVADDLDVVVIDRVDASRAVRIYSKIGDRAPAHATSLGKILLAYRDAATWRSTYPSRLPRYTERTITQRDVLIRQLRAARRAGVAFNFGEWRVEVAGVASAIFDHRGQPVAAVNISVPMIRTAPGLLRDCSQAVRQAARDISQLLGHSGAPSEREEAAGTRRRNDGIRAH